MKKRSLINLLVLLFPVCLYPQVPDYEIDRLYAVGGTVSDHSPELDANVRLYSDGRNISVVVEVRDKHIEIERAHHLSDHIVLWFALPKSAYPRDFEYRFHPNYILSSPMRTRGMERRKSPSRLFSVYAEYARELDVNSFLNDYDYPHSSRFGRDVLRVPPTYHLRKEQVPFGLVKLGLFPDRRPAKLYHEEKYHYLEETMNLRVGDFAQGVKYTVDFLDDEKGYVINAEISPEALGFVTLPELKELNFMVEILDKGGNPRGVRPVLRSLRSAPSSLEALTTINLRRPLHTNFTSIPDRLFYDAGLRPLGVWGHERWVPVKVDTDAIALREQVLSRYLVEVQFRPMPISYASYHHEGIPVEKIEVHEHFVNLMNTKYEYIWVEGQLIKTSVSLNKRLAGRAGVGSEYFQFPNGSSGLVVKENRTVDQYGWGTCGGCLEEIITFYKIDTGYHEKVFTIRQGDGDNYCQIGTNNFDGFFVSKIDWIDKGRMLVLLLDHWENSEERKRVIVSWDKEGENVQVTTDR